MRTVKETTKPESKEVVNEFKLQEAFVLWKNKSKSGNDYLKGSTPTDKDGKKTGLIAYFNSNKKNPKEPDIRVYSLVDGEQDIEVASLWESVSEGKGTRYLTGTTNDKEKLVAFYGKENQEMRPYIRAYYKED